MSRKKKNKAETGLEPGADLVPSHIRPIDIQQQEFRTSFFGGYKARDVDEFLDRLTEELARVIEENKSLQAGVLGLPAGSVEAEQAVRQAHAEAEHAVRQARAEAEGILRDARAAGRGSTADPMAAVWPFLQKEREFLRLIAGAIQEHAEGVKHQARDLQAVSAPEKRTAPGEPPRARPEKPAEVAGTGSVWEATAPAQASDDAPVVTIPPSPVDTPGGDVGGDEGSKRAKPPAEGDAGDGKDQAPSLRELFWGEER